MNINDLKVRLDKEKIPKNWYSIDCICGCDIFVLRKVKKRYEHYAYWEFFYVDERGGENNAYKRFDIESEACEYLFNKLIDTKHNFKSLEDYPKRITKEQVFNKK